MMKQQLLFGDVEKTFSITHSHSTISLMFSFIYLFIYFSSSESEFPVLKACKILSIANS